MPKTLLFNPSAQPAATVTSCLTKAVAVVWLSALLLACTDSDRAATGADVETVVAPAPAQARNLVLICIDTVRSDSLLDLDTRDSTAGGPVTDALTPWLESVLNYRNTQATSPWTIPSVASVMTGLYPAQHGAGQFSGPVANLNTQVPSPLVEDAQTITELLRDAGYRIGGFVAHPWFSADFGLDQGFGRIHRQKRWDQLVAAFDRWLGKSTDPQQPFFGYLHLMDAHSTHNQPPKALAAQIEAAAPEQLAEALARSQVANCQPPYNLRCQKNLVYNLQVAKIRQAIADTLGSLEQANALEDTVVVVYSDHGEAFWEHQQAVVELGGDPRNSQRDYGHGQTLYQTLLDVPLLVWHPANPQGGSIDQLASLVDIYPSLLTWLGLPAPDVALPGQVLPLTPVNSEPRNVYASGIAYGPEQIAVRASEGNEDHKAVWHAQIDQIRQFDLVADPAERNPVDDTNWLWALEPRIGDYQEMPTLGAGAAPQVTSEQLERLKAIGYLQGIESEQDADATQTTAETDAVEEEQDSAKESPEDEP